MFFSFCVWQRNTLTAAVSAPNLSVEQAAPPKPNLTLPALPQEQALTQLYSIFSRKIIQIIQDEDIKMLQNIGLVCFQELL